jgi:hypothetical protein
MDVKLKFKPLQIAEPSQALERCGSTGMTPQVQLLQPLQCAERLQAGKSERDLVACFRRKALEVQ